MKYATKVSHSSSKPVAVRVVPKIQLGLEDLKSKNFLKLAVPQISVLTEQKHNKKKLIVENVSSLDDSSLILDDISEQICDKELNPLSQNGKYS